MHLAKLFENGRSQAVRLPKDYRFNDDEVIINKIGDIVIIMPKNNKYSGMLEGIKMFTSDFMDDGRNQHSNQERESL